MQYARFPAPYSLVTDKQPTNVVNFSDGTAITIPEGTPFEAVGKATTPDNRVFFMTANSFGNADVSGVPFETYGVSTSDLKPPAPTTTAASVTPTVNEDGSANIPVTVKPSSLQSSYTAFLSPQEYVASANVTIHEYDTDLPITITHPETRQLVKGQLVVVAGTFTDSGIRYYRTKKSVESGYWYGIPTVSLTKPGDEDDDIDTLVDEIKNEASTKHEVAVATVGTVDGFFTKLLHKNKKQ